MTTLVNQSATDAKSDTTRWRLAGAFGLGHILVMLGAFALEGVADLEHGSSPAHVQKVLGSLGVRQLELATYVEAMAFVVLVPAVILFARQFGRANDTARIAAQCFGVLATVYIAATLAVAFAPLQAATYAAHHGVDPSVVATVLDVRNYSFLLQVAITAAFALALGVAAIASGSFTRWAGYGGVAVGVVGLAATPFEHNMVMMAWMIWWVGLSVLALRGGPKSR